MIEDVGYVEAWDSEIEALIGIRRGYVSRDVQSFVVEIDRRISGLV